MPNWNVDTASGYSLTGTAVFDSTVSRTADGSGSIKITGTSTGNGVRTPSLPIAESGYYQYSYFVRSNQVPRIHGAQLNKGSGGNFDGLARGQTSVAGEWQEIVKVRYIDTNEMGSVRIQIFAREEPDSGKYATPFWIDEFSLTRLPDQLNPTYVEAPSPKDSFDGEDGTRIDWLGNWYLYNKDTEVWEDFFPWMMHTLSGRSDFSAYADNGWNVNIWASADAVIDKDVAGGIKSMFQMSIYIQNFQPAYADYATLHTRMNEIIASGNSDNLIGYYWDHEFDWDEWDVPNRVIDILRSKMDLPVYTLHGNEQATAGSAVAGQGDIFGSYIHDEVDNTNSETTFTIQAMHHQPGNAKPGNVAQISTTYGHPGEHRMTIYNCYIAGSRAFAYYADGVAGTKTMEDSKWFYDMPLIVAERDTLNDILKTPEWVVGWGVTSPTKNVKVGARELNGNKYVICCNQTSSKQKVQIRFSGSHGLSTGDPVTDVINGWKLGEVYNGTFEFTLDAVGTNRGTVVLWLNGTATTTYSLKLEFNEEESPGPMSSPYSGDAGSVTLVQTNADMSMISGEQIIPTPSSTFNWTGLGWYADSGITRQFGQCIKWKVHTTSNDSFSLGWSATQSVSQAKNFGVEFNVDDLYYRVGGSSAIIADTTVSSGVDYEFLLSYDDQSRQRGAILIKGGTYTEWTLLGVFACASDTTVFPAVANFDGAAKIDHCRQPTASTAPWFPKPILAASFDGSDTTTLRETDGDACGVIAGGGITLTEATGDFEHMSNRLWSVGAVTSIVTAPAVADIMAVVTSQAPSGGPHGIVFRYTDANNYWLAAYDIADGNYKLIEYVAGSPNVRETLTDSLAANTDVTLRIWCSGSTIRMWGGVAFVEHTSTANQNATTVGLKSNGVDNVQFDDFAVWAVDQQGQVPEF